MLTPTITFTENLPIIGSLTQALTEKAFSFGGLLGAAFESALSGKTFTGNVVIGTKTNADGSEDLTEAVTIDDTVGYGLPAILGDFTDQQVIPTALKPFVGLLTSSAGTSLGFTLTLVKS